MKNINFLSENFHFLMVKFSVYLKRHGFVMENKTGLSLLPTLHYKVWLFQGGSSVAVLLCTSVVCFVISYLSFIWCLGKAVLRDCGISCVSSLIFLLCKKATGSHKSCLPNKKKWQILQVYSVYLGLYCWQMA